jgi:hypothetical protein
MNRLAGILGVLFFRLSVKLVHYAHAADARKAAAEHIAVSCHIAGWPAGTADALLSRNIGPAEAARLFADALRPERVQ